MAAILNYKYSLIQKLQNPSPITCSKHLWVIACLVCPQTDAAVVMAGAQVTHLAALQCSSCKGHHIARHAAFQTEGGKF